MYGEPFLVPEPLETVLISWFEGGEVFRSGLTWQRGAGRIFYFRPGHETYPTYHDATVQQLLRNAVHWAYNPAAAWTDVAEAPNVPVDKAPGEDHRRRARPCTSPARRASGDPAGEQRLLILGTGAIARTPRRALRRHPRLRAGRRRRHERRARPRLRRRLRRSPTPSAASPTPSPGASSTPPSTRPPTRSHQPTTLELIAAGKPVFCEKPLALEPRRRHRDDRGRRGRRPRQHGQPHLPQRQRACRPPAG